MPSLLVLPPFVVGDNAGQYSELSSLNKTQLNVEARGFISVGAVALPSLHLGTTYQCDAVRDQALRHAQERGFLVEFFFFFLRFHFMVFLVCAPSQKHPFQNPSAMPR